MQEKTKKSLTVVVTLPKVLVRHGVLSVRSPRLPRESTHTTANP